MLVEHSLSLVIIMKLFDDNDNGNFRENTSAKNLGQNSNDDVVDIIDILFLGGNR